MTTWSSPVSTPRIRCLHMLRLSGRLQSFRVAGPKLVFIDLLQEGHVVQGLCNFRGLEDTGVTEQGFKVFYHKLRRGDILSKVTG